MNSPWGNPAIILVCQYLAPSVVWLPVSVVGKREHFGEISSRTAFTSDFSLILEVNYAQSHFS